MKAQIYYADPFFISKVSIRTQTYLCTSSQRILPKVITVWFVRYYHYGKKVELRKRKKGSMINEHLFKKMFTYYSCLSVSRTRNLCSALLNKSYSNDFLLSCMLGWVLYTEVFLDLTKSKRYTFNGEFRHTYIFWHMADAGASVWAGFPLFLQIEYKSRRIHINFLSKRARRRRLSF